MGVDFFLKKPRKQANCKVDSEEQFGGMRKVWNWFIGHTKMNVALPVSCCSCFDNIHWLIYL